jgi:hypothetical protein
MRVATANRRGSSQRSKEKNGVDEVGWKWGCGEMGAEGEVKRSKFESSVTSLLLAEGPRVQPRKNSDHTIFLGLGY